MPTAVQIAQGRQIPLTAGLFMAFVSNSPTLQAIDARTARGRDFLSLVATGLPSVKTFAKYNDGFTPAEAGFTLRRFEMAFLGGQIRAERDAARVWNEEHVASGYTWFDLQTMLNFRAHGENINRQIYVGGDADADGFPGFNQVTPFTSSLVMAAGDIPAESRFAKTVINAAGTTDGQATSVYAWIEGELDVQLVIGNDLGNPQSELFQLSEMVTSNEAPNPATPTKKSLHDVQQFSGHMALAISGFNQVANSVVPTQYSVRRIANLTKDSGKGLTDALMQQLSTSFGNTKRPTRFAMSTRSGDQLARSRSSVAVLNVNMGPGAAAQQSFNTAPPPPDNWNGIPIIYDDFAIDADGNIES